MGKPLRAEMKAPMPYYVFVPPALPSLWFLYLDALSRGREDVGVMPPSTIGKVLDCLEEPDGRASP